MIHLLLASLELLDIFSYKSYLYSLYTILLLRILPFYVEKALSPLNVKVFTLQIWVGLMLIIYFNFSDEMAPCLQRLV